MSSFDFHAYKKYPTVPPAKPLGGHGQRGVHLPPPGRHLGQQVGSPHLIQHLPHLIQLHLATLLSTTPDHLELEKLHQVCHRVPTVPRGQPEGTGLRGGVGWCIGVVAPVAPGAQCGALGGGLWPDRPAGPAGGERGAARNS